MKLEENFTSFIKIHVGHSTSNYREPTTIQERLGKYHVLRYSYKKPHVPNIVELIMDKQSYDDTTQRTP